jgi:hypothetical protein
LTVKLLPENGEPMPEQGAKNISPPSHWKSMTVKIWNIRHFLSIGFQNNKRKGL